MSYAVEESAAAAHDLDAIIAYHVDTLKSPRAAKRVLDEYEQLIDTLEQTPWAFPLVRDELMSFAGYRWASVSSYMVFFTVAENDDKKNQGEQNAVSECEGVVSIHRIAHESRNWTRLLR